jgi:hypothetical protein
MADSGEEKTGKLRSPSESNPSKKAQARRKPVTLPKPVVKNYDITSTFNGNQTETAGRKDSKSSVGEALVVKDAVECIKTDGQESNGKGEARCATATGTDEQLKDVKDGGKPEDKVEKDGEDGDKKVKNRRPRNRSGRGRSGFQAFQGYPRGFYPWPPQFFGGYYNEPDHYYGMQSPPYKHNMVQENPSRKGRKDDERNRSDSAVQGDRRAEERDRPGFFAARTYLVIRGRKTSEKAGGDGDDKDKDKEGAVESSGEKTEKAEGAEGAAEGENKKRRRRKKRSKRPVMNDGLQPEYLDHRFDGHGWYSPPQRYGGYHMQPLQSYGGYRNYVPSHDRGYLEAPEYHQPKPRYNNQRDQQNGYNLESTYRDNVVEQQQPQGNRKSRQRQNNGPKMDRTWTFDNFTEVYQANNGGGRRRNSGNNRGFHGRKRQDTETSQASDAHVRGHSFNGVGKAVPVTLLSPPQLDQFR